MKARSPSGMRTACATWAAYGRHLLRDRRGATAVEYGFILALVVLAMLSALSALGDTTTSIWNNVNSAVSNAH